MTRFVSPSYKRAGSVEVIRWLPEVALAVHSFEAEEYRAAYPDAEILEIPDSRRGNMGKVRNWLLEKAMPEDKRLVMLDDDVEYVGFHQTGEMRQMTVEQFRSLVEMGFTMAEDVGAYLWGVNLQVDPKFYREYGPVSFLLPILGTFSAHRPSPLRYDERLSLNEDYDYFLQHVQRYHRTLRLNKYHYRAGHLTDDGGCAAYRTLSEEFTQAGIMQRKWGRDVVRFDLARSTNPRIRVPLKGS